MSLLSLYENFCMRVFSKFSIFATFHLFVSFFGCGTGDFSCKSCLDTRDSDIENGAEIRLNQNDTGGYDDCENSKSEAGLECVICRKDLCKSEGSANNRLARTRCCGNDICYSCYDMIMSADTCHLCCLDLCFFHKDAPGIFGKCPFCRNRSEFPGEFIESEVRQFLEKITEKYHDCDNDEFYRELFREELEKNREVWRRRFPVLSWVCEEGDDLLEKLFIKDVKLFIKNFKRETGDGGKDSLEEYSKQIREKVEKKLREAIEREAESTSGGSNVAVRTDNGTARMGGTWGVDYFFIFVGSGFGFFLLYKLYRWYKARKVRVRKNKINTGRSREMYSRYKTKR